MTGPAAGGGNQSIAELRADYRELTPEERLAQAAELSEIATGLAAEADASDRPSRATSIEEIRKRTGTKPMSPDDFDRHFGSLAVDGEG